MERLGYNRVEKKKPAGKNAGEIKMKLTLARAAAEDYKQIKPLYKSAFPPEERPPFFMMRWKAASGKGQVLAARDAGEFVGFLYIVEHCNLIYLFFLAIEPEKRGKSYGSHILRLLQEQCRGKRIVLAREQLDKTAPNYEQRVKRHGFYRKNGFQDLPWKIKEAGVVYDAMGFGGDIAAREYDALISDWRGALLKKLVDMRAIEEETTP